MKMRYKKCDAGHINKYLPGEDVANCTYPGCKRVCREVEYVFDESADVMPVEEEKKDTVENGIDAAEIRYKYALSDEDKGIFIPIPVNANDVPLGRAGLGGDQKYWGYNISRKHLYVSSKASGLFIKEGGSTNGTLINNKLLERNEVKYVSAGDVIILDAKQMDVCLLVVQNEEYH